ncbi:hypothetical protein DENSPDRAFT_219278 [Dentipellis sp. KUC8613]|nr:hypothetical protein DENSPDRAFT_219278 [Dentipellis sp. KUC8613]
MQKPLLTEGGIGQSCHNSPKLIMRGENKGVFFTTAVPPSCSPQGQYVRPTFLIHLTYDTAPSTTKNTRLLEHTFLGLPTGLHLSAKRITQRAPIRVPSDSHRHTNSDILCHSGRPGPFHLGAMRRSLLVYPILDHHPSCPTWDVYADQIVGPTGAYTWGDIKTTSTSLLQSFFYDMCIRSDPWHQTQVLTKSTYLRPSPSNPLT